MSDHEHPVDPERVGMARSKLPSTEEATEVAELFRLLGDPVRARIMYGLTGADELCVGDLALALGVPESSVSYALRLLRTAGVVRKRREGRLIYYRLVDGFMAQLLDLLRHQVQLDADE
ncbi:MAG: winged helix-turn-helix transcriptional regulator [Euzebyales bacterium]|nr:winged helix-turn-helix transcriptional regulator [Euzebyales bacterium]